MVWAPWSICDAAPSPIKTPQWEKPKHPITFPETYHGPPPLLTRDREGPEALPGTLPERGIATCRWISCHNNTGYHATDPKIRTQGAEHVRSWIATKHGDGSLECRMRYALQRETPSFTQVQGPRGEVKPLLPAFLYCNVTPREEYKALVTKL
jgi:hypothetical protein